MTYQTLDGEWNVLLQDGTKAKAVLPGTLDENRIGHGDENREQWHPEVQLEQAAQQNSAILTRLTRQYSYEGPAVFSRAFTMQNTMGRRLFLEAERSRRLTCRVNGREAEARMPGTVSTPSVFEITEQIRQGENSCELCCDNSYPGWPRKAIVFSSAATDETQTNWNGILGYLRLRSESTNFIEALRVYPGEGVMDVYADLDCGAAYSGAITVRSPALKEPFEKAVSLSAGRHSVHLAALPVADDVRRWDEDDGAVYPLSLSGDGLEEKTVAFGIRTFGDRQGRLALNGRFIFLCSETGCCVFPETGHMPMTEGEWETVLRMYRSYGVNCLRFHSHCPPEAAFAAADRMGMLMQPELSHWNATNAFEEEESFAYYSLELERILMTYANHPSFVMLTFGNELHAGELGHRRMEELLERARKLDATRLYAWASNPHYGNLGPDDASDFYTSSNNGPDMIRGTSANMAGYINQSYPSACRDYSQEMARLRQSYGKPVFSFEVGQYEVLPDFDELADYRGVTRPDNITAVRDKAAERGMLTNWKKLVEATGELSLLAYREEVEAVLRTPELSGISLLGLQDFPGQGTALVGMLNAHLRPKPFPFAQPGRFQTFFTDAAVLILLPRYTYTAGEPVRAEVKLANYSKEELAGGCSVYLSDGEAQLDCSQLPERLCPCGTLTSLGEFAFSTDSLAEARQLTVTAEIAGRSVSYDLWVYPEQLGPNPPQVFITRSVREAAEALEMGKTVFLDPVADKEHFPGSVKAQFTTDFWSVGTFPEQEGFMGCCMDPEHPVFQGFPTKFHSQWQWWPMCRGRAVILPEGMEPLVTAVDCYAYMRKMGMLLEAKVGQGKLMLSSMGLQDHRQHPEVRALQHSILSYMASGRFEPVQDMSREVLSQLVADA